MDSRARTKLPTRTKLLAAAPAAIVVAMTAVVASGMSVVSSATASSVGVQGSVTPAVLIDASPSGAGCPVIGTTNTFDMGSTWNGTPTVAAGGACTVTFATNGGIGAEVLFKNANAGAQVFCNDPDNGGALPRSCASGNVTDVVGTGNTLNAGADRFGLALMAVGGDGGTVAGTGVSGADAAPLPADAIWAGIPANAAAGSQLCRTSGPSTGSTCDFTVGVHGKGAATQPSGTYTGTINFATQTL